MSDTCLYVDDRGSGRPVVLVHGWSAHSGVWGPLADDLRAGCRVLRVDLRGHGRSRALPGPWDYPALAADLADLLHTRGLERPLLIGWSMGVAVVLTLLARHGCTPAGLVCISGNPCQVSRPDYPHGVPATTITRLQRLLSRSFEAGLQAFTSLLLEPHETVLPEAAALLQQLRDPNLTPAPDAARETLACLATADLRTAAAGLAVPTLIIHGTADRVCPCAAAHWLHDAIPGSRLLSIEGCGHVPFVTNRDRVGRALEDFIAGLP